MRLPFRALTRNWQLKLAALSLAVLLWVVLMYRTYNGETWHVPLAGDLAAKIAAR